MEIEKYMLFFLVIFIQNHTQIRLGYSRAEYLISHFARLNDGLTRQSGLIEASRLNQVYFTPGYAEKAPRQRKITEGTPLCFVKVLG